MFCRTTEVPLYASPTPTEFCCRASHFFECNGGLMINAVIRVGEGRGFMTKDAGRARGGP
jgi:hypothetical protein